MINPDYGFTANNLRYVIGDLGGASMIFNGKEIKGDIMGISSTLEIKLKKIFLCYYIL